MKYFIATIFQVTSCCSLLNGQPTISNNEFYHQGDAFQFANCDFSGFNPGTEGANQIWDFTGLTTGGNSYLKVRQDTTAGFSTFDLLIARPDGLLMHVNENSTDSYIDGVTDPVSGITTFYNNCDNSKRPFTYMSAYVDTYTVYIPGSMTHGRGQINTTGDGYGTLKLPTGSFSNVLRIHKHQTEIDSSETPDFIYFSVGDAYQWFDNVHSAPLLEIDTEYSTLSSYTYSIRYLSSVAGIQNTEMNSLNCTGYFNKNDLILNGNFLTGAVYEVTLFNLQGVAVYNAGFMATGKQLAFNLNCLLSTGLYVLRITGKSEDSGNDLIKVINY